MRAVNSTEPGKRALLKFEHMTKSAALGCETCGFCRIEHLNYVCPETCPKGLANGPCSGTDDNVCEFKEREFRHNRKYRGSAERRAGNECDKTGRFPGSPE